jgi:hypothetical protein
LVRSYSVMRVTDWMPTSSAAAASAAKAASWVAAQVVSWVLRLTTQWSAAGAAWAVPGANATMAARAMSADDAAASARLRGAWCRGSLMTGS